MQIFSIEKMLKEGYASLRMTRSMAEEGCSGLRMATSMAYEGRANLKKIYEEEHHDEASRK